MKESISHNIAVQVAHELYPELTERQAVVVYLTALAGMDVTASSLGISVKTVREHLDRAKEKLDFSSQSELRLTTILRLNSLTYQAVAGV